MGPTGATLWLLAIALQMKKHQHLLQHLSEEPNSIGLFMLAPQQRLRQTVTSVMGPGEDSDVR